MNDQCACEPIGYGVRRADGTMIMKETWCLTHTDCKVVDSLYREPKRNQPLGHHTVHDLRQKTRHRMLFAGLAAPPRRSPQRMGKQQRLQEHTLHLHQPQTGKTKKLRGRVAHPENLCYAINTTEKPERKKQ